MARRCFGQIGLAGIKRCAAAAGVLTLPSTHVRNDMSTQIEAMMKSIEEEHGVVRKPRASKKIPDLPIKLDGDDPELDYKFKHVIGKGAIGIVRLAVARTSNEKVAVKVIHLKHVKNEMLHNEVETLRKIKEFGGHPTIIDFKGVYLNKSAMYLVTELMAGGEVFSHLERKGTYSERDAARLLRQVAQGISFLHQNGVIHGDLKPENLVLSTADDDDEHVRVKVIDFGCAKVGSPDGEPKYSPMDQGTPAYCAPEVLKEKLSSTQQDSWALGVIMYTMLGGAHPFSDFNTDHTKLVERICNQKVAFNGKQWADVSDEAKHLIQQMMNKDMKQRYTIDQFLQHPWISDEISTSDRAIEGSGQRLAAHDRARRDLKARLLRTVIHQHKERLRKELSSSSNRKERGAPGPTTKYASTADRRRISDLGKELQAVSGAISSLSMFDKEGKGYVTPADIQRAMEEAGESSGRAHMEAAHADALIKAATTRSSRQKAGHLDTDADSLQNITVSEGDSQTRMMQEDYNKIIGELQQMEYNEGDVVFEQGDAAHNFYFVTTGELEVVARVGDREKVVGRLKEGQYFGESGMLTIKPRNATVRCLTPVSLITLGKQDFQDLMGSDTTTSNLKDQIIESSDERSVETVKAVIAMTVKIKGKLGKASFTQGDTICRKGEPGDCMYSINKGVCTVQTEPEEASSDSTFLLKEGDVFGERSLLTGERRNATVTCSAPACEFGILRQAEFLELLKSAPQIASSLAVLKRHRTHERVTAAQSQS